MQAFGRVHCRLSFCRACRASGKPLLARNFHATSRQAESSQEPPKLPDEDYSQVHIDPESKTVTTAVGSLPISPFMEPSFYAARQRFTRPKPRHSEHKLTKFQRTLARNPYARALATPVRRCLVSQVSLPTFFLQRFGLVSDPKTQRPWIVPRDLEPRKLAAAEEATSTATANEAAVGTPPGPESTDVAREENPRQARTGPSAYLLSRQTLFQELQRLSSPYFGGHKRLFRMSAHTTSHLLPVVNSAQWPGDMDAALLELMRRRVVEGLLHFANMVEQHGREYIVKCERWDDALRLKHRGCLLFLGRHEATSSESSLEFVPPRLSTMDVPSARFGKKLVVHDLPALLGQEHAGRLRQESALLRDGTLFLLGRQATVNLQMLIWKLQGYMAWEEPPRPSHAVQEKPTVQEEPALQDEPDR